MLESAINMSDAAKCSKKRSQISESASDTNLQSSTPNFWHAAMHNKVFKQVVSNLELDWSLRKFGACLRTLQCFNTCAALGTWKHDLLLAGSNDSGTWTSFLTKRCGWTIQLHSYVSRNATGCTTSCLNAETYQNQENWFLILSASIWKLCHSSGRNSYTRFPLSSVNPRDLATWNFPTISWRDNHS